MKALSAAAAASVAALALAAALPAAAAPVPLELDAFRTARIESAIEARIVVGDVQSVEVEAMDPRALKDLRVEVVNGQMRAWLEESFWDLFDFRHDKVRLTVTVPALDAIAATSAAEISIVGPSGDSLEVTADSAASIALTEVAVADLRLAANSAAHIVASGSCGKAVVRVDSVARVDAGALKCTDLDVSSDSAAHARVSASGNVEAHASSASRIELIGRPAGRYMDVSSAADIDVID